MSTPVWIVDAFTNRIFCGNPAGVVPSAEHLTEQQMQAIANELHASETAFVLKPTDPNEADLRLRYFTPQQEVDLCGHATIGSICALVEQGQILLTSSEGTVRVETRVGVLLIRYGHASGQAWAEMRQAAPQFRDTSLDLKEISEILGLTAHDIDSDFPAGLCYTGLWDCMIPLRTLESMHRIRPNWIELGKWNDRLGVVSTHVYTTSCEEPGHHFHTRDFAPTVGILEDPATGTATGALLAILHKAGVVQPGTVYQFEQGYEIGRPSVISARVEPAGDSVDVYVGGRATFSLTGQLNL